MAEAGTESGIKTAPADSENGRGLSGVDKPQGGAQGDSENGRGLSGVDEPEGGAHGDSENGRGLSGVDEPEGGAHGDSENGRGMSGVDEQQGDSENGRGLGGVDEHLGAATDRGDGAVAHVGDKPPIPTGDPEEADPSVGVQGKIEPDIADDPLQDQDAGQVNEDDVPVGGNGQDVDYTPAFSLALLLKVVFELISNIFYGAVNAVRETPRLLRDTFTSAVHDARIAAVATEQFASSACSIIMRFLQNPRQEMEALRKYMEKHLNFRSLNSRILYHDILDFVDGIFHNLVPLTPGYYDLMLNDDSAMKRNVIIHVNLFRRAWIALREAKSEKNAVFRLVLKPIHYFQRITEWYFNISASYLLDTLSKLV